MPDTGVISRVPALLPSQDFALLRSEGLEHIADLGHEQWTDYNVHDPGIAILELACYALTELGYRTGYPVRDLLTRMDRGTARTIGEFHEAHHILPCNPVSFDDLRKLLIDIAGIRNAWISKHVSVKHCLDRPNGLLVECPDDPDAVPVNGLYDVYVDFDEFVEESRARAAGIPKRPDSGGRFLSPGNRGIVFNTEYALTLESVSVYAASGGTIKVALQDRDGRTIARATGTVPAQHPALDPARVALGFDVPAGEGHRLVATGGTARIHCLRANELVDAFPFSSEGLIHLVGGVQNGVPRPDYNCFYDWIVSFSVPPLASFRPPVRSLEAGLEEDQSTGGFIVAPGKGLELTAARDLTVKSFTVHAERAGSIRIELLDITGGSVTPVSSTPASVTEGASRIDLSGTGLERRGLELKGGRSYRVEVSHADTRLHRTSGVTYPFGEDNVLQFTGGVPGAATYYFFYDWEIEVPLQPRAMVVTRGDVLLATRDRLNTHRNLCEDYVDVCELEREEIAVCADLIVTPGSDIEEILAEAFNRLRLHVSPDVNFYSYEEMLEKGRTTDQIYEGPLLDHGFIDDEEFRAIRRICEIRTSDVVRILMDVPGVEAIKSISLLSFIDGVFRVQEPWVLQLVTGAFRAPEFSPDESNFTFFQNGLPYAANRARVDRLSQEKKALQLRTKLKGYPTALATPVGTDRQVREYWPIQNELPQNFRVGQIELPSSAPALDQAQARQLKAFLLFFEQILANHLAQLSHVSELFSWSGDSDSTYFTQPVHDFAQFQRIYNRDGILARLASASVAAAPDPGNDEEQKLTAFLADLTNALEVIVEDANTFEDRRNRFLDHLVGRFSEDLGAYPALMGTLLNGKSAARLIEDKRSFLGDYPVTSARRGTGVDYRWATRPGDVSGFQRRVYRLLGIDDISRRDLAGRRIRIEEIVKAGETQWRFVVRADADDPASGNIFESMSCASAEAVEVLIDRVLAYGSDAEGFQPGLTNYAPRWRLNVVGDVKELIWRCPDDPDDTVLGATTTADDSVWQSLVQYLQGVHLAEGLHLVEHVLLRRRTSDDPFMSVQLQDPGECDCVEVVDPYSFRASVVLPSWSPRFRDVRFRRLVEDTLRAEAPAHVFLKICWVSHEQMRDLEECLTDWSEKLAGLEASLGRCSRDMDRNANPHLAGAMRLPPSTTPEHFAYGECLGALINKLETLVTMHPIASLHGCDSDDANEDDQRRSDTPKVTLNNTNLGTL